jgi:cell wall-associated NlpC family hydrolase
VISAKHGKSVSKINSGGGSVISAKHGKSVSKINSGGGSVISAKHSSGTMTTSRGLFQQIAAWAPEPDRMDPTKAATMFYTGGTAGQRGLMQVPGWQNMPAPQAAQAVQGSQFSSGSNYAAQLPLAQQVTAAVMATCTAQTPTTGSVGGAIVAAAQSQLRVRYSWGGGSLTGPTLGQHDGGVADSFGDFAAIGWDCSGLTRFAVYQATRGQVTIPRTAADQRGAGSPVAADLAQMLPGDLVVFGTEHVGIYVGGGRIIDAPQSGTVVRYDSLTGGGVNGDPATWTVRRIIPGASAS